ncbi:Transposon Ty3-G Gag-Pol polyprotein [Nosema granulosis]|uniref:Transposon Ty3-G Gag-Pol polyprotein n=1 Tax=Nosema granulosis TaxID=83296 RepID=A0A9P6KYA3_9MICR|nr:Transposon Ty3-G Gag-Pol polyprotein [Nosema granulosis]
MYASRTLGDTEKNYSISEKEMLAVLWGMEKFEYFLKGGEFTLVTDHIALKALNAKGEIKSPRITRWIERIQQFSFKVEYKLGEMIHHVDGISRLVNDRTVAQIDELDSKTWDSKIIKLHEDLVHRGDKVVTEEYNRCNIDKISEDTCRKILAKCLKCKLCNPIRVGRVRDIEAFEMGENFLWT